MRDPRLLEYSPSRAARLQRELQEVRNLLYSVYTHREQSSPGDLYEGEGSIHFSRRHLIIAQKQLRLKLNDLLEDYAAILVHLASLDDLYEWRRDIRRAASDTMTIDPEDPGPDLVGKEIWSALATLDAWIGRIADDCSWPRYTIRYVLQNRVQLAVALFLGILTRFLFDTVTAIILGVTLTATRGATTETSEPFAGADSWRCYSPEDANRHRFLRWMRHVLTW